MTASAADMPVPPWILPIFVFLAWCVWAVGSMGANELRQARNGVPQGKREGEPILPFILVYPLVFWGIAVLIDRFAAPWGTVLIGAGHAALVVAWIIWIRRDLKHLKALDSGAQRGQSN